MIKLPNEEELDPGEVLPPLRRHDFMNGVRFTLAEVQRLNTAAQPVSEHNGKVADALESLLWPNMASGNKDIINEAVRALRATSAQSLSDDTRRMDYLVSKVVNVREPLLYGSHSILWSEEITDEEDDHYENRLREQIDALLAMRPGGQNE